MLHSTTATTSHAPSGFRAPKALQLIAGALSALAALSACTAPPVVPPSVVEPASVASPTPASASFPADLDQQFLLARQLVEDFTDTQLQDVVLQVTSDENIAKEVAHETGRLINSQFDNPAFAQHFLQSVMQSQNGTYAALYASRLKRIMLSRALLSSYRESLPEDPQLRNAATLSLLIHELVHAADDQRFQIHNKRRLNFRASFAQSAAFEGHAQWATREICARVGCEAGLKALDHFMFSRDTPPNQLTQSVQAISRNVLEYSYIEGERFLSALAQRNNGKALIAQLLSNPPSDPIQILNPDSYPDRSREQRNQSLLQAIDRVTHPWHSGEWVRVETSPLKGVNLRADPGRRQAAVDGFTRLIQAMVALQLYDQSSVDRPPIEVTLLRTDSADTARLFARTLHQNTQTGATQMYSEQLPGNVMFLRSTEPTLGESGYHTMIAVSGTHVIQASGYASVANMRNYTLNGLSELIR